MGWVWYDWLAFALFVAGFVGLFVWAYYADERDARQAIQWCPFCGENLPRQHVARKRRA